MSFSETVKLRLTLTRSVKKEPAEASSERIIEFEADKLDTYQCTFCHLYYLAKPCGNISCRQTCEGCSHGITAKYPPPVPISEDAVREKIRQTNFCSVCAQRHLASSPEYRKSVFQQFKQKK